ncbi:MAG TPA: hypothetical protein VIT23_11780 [Terrimicrobiaceae bacterium]
MVEQQRAARDVLTVGEMVEPQPLAAAPDGTLDFMPSGGPADPQIERDQLHFQR